MFKLIILIILVYYLNSILIKIYKKLIIKICLNIITQFLLWVNQPRKIIIIKKTRRNKKKEAILRIQMIHLLQILYLVILCQFLLPKMIKKRNSNFILILIKIFYALDDLHHLKNPTLMKIWKNIPLRNQRK